jgi:hypothetical protein
VSCLSSISRYHCILGMLHGDTVLCESAFPQKKTVSFPSYLSGSSQVTPCSPKSQRSGTSVPLTDPTCPLKKKFIVRSGTIKVWVTPRSASVNTARSHQRTALDSGSFHHAAGRMTETISVVGLPLLCFNYSRIDRQERQGRDMV